jgi:copper chaperone
MSETTTTWHVTGMTCGHCAASVTEEITEIPGVEKVDVTVESGEVVVTSSQPLEREAVAAAVTEAGYTLD